MTIARRTTSASAIALIVTAASLFAPSAPATAAPANRIGSTFIEVAGPITHGRSETVEVVLLDDTNRPFPATVTVTATPKGHRPRTGVTRRMNGNGRTSVQLPASFAGTVTATYRGDRTQRAAHQTERIAPPTKPVIVFVLPTSVTFGHVLGCKRIDDDTEVDVTYTVVFHGGRYTDLGGSGPATDVLVPGGDHTVTVESNDGSIVFGGQPPLPAQPFTQSFTPTYYELVGPYTGDPFTKLGASKPVDGTFPDQTTTC